MGDFRVGWYFKVKKRLPGPLTAHFLALAVGFRLLGGKLTKVNRS